MSPNLTLRQKYPQLFTRDSGATPATLTLPDNRGAALELLTVMQREIVYARRTADAARIRAGMRPVNWSGAPRYAKLRFRPMVYGSSPMVSARSTVPFDDQTGDGLAKRWGLPGGFHQLIACAKLANLYPAPVADLPLEMKTEQVRQDLIEAQIKSGLFDDRVVILVGKEAARVFGYDTSAVADFAGPLDRSRVPGAREVLTMPDPQESTLWGTKDGRASGRLVLVRALLAARLPVAQGTLAATYASWLAAFCSSEAYENRRHSHEAMLAWSAMTGEEVPDLGALVGGPAVQLWQYLCRIGLAPPRDLGANAWWFDSPTSTSTMFLDRGRAVVSGARGKTKRCALQRPDGTTVCETEKPERSDGLRWAEDAAVVHGWTHAHVALDRRLAALHGGRS